MKIQATGYCYKITRCDTTGKIKTKRVPSKIYKKGQTFDGLLDPKLYK